MQNTDFVSLVESITNLLEDDGSPKEMNVRMKKFGYSGPQQGTHGHTTFTKENDPADQMLVDVPGGEWHHMTKGVVNHIGKMDDDSLEQYLESHNQ
jgi:hypothetical protein